MPEGHTVHRVAAQLQHNFAGQPLEVTSPQGRFAVDAQKINDHFLLRARAHGKQLFLCFASEGQKTSAKTGQQTVAPAPDLSAVWVQVHLGLYGAWDFFGRISLAPGLASGPMEASTLSIGAPRLRRDSPSSSYTHMSHLHMGERERRRPVESAAVLFPPPPVGQVRMRLLGRQEGREVCADLRGPAICRLLTWEQVLEVRARLGPDPAEDASRRAGQRFISRAQRSQTPIGQLLMNQQAVAGIGNIYRAELLFRAEQNPHTPSREIPEATLRQLWEDWARLLRRGIKTGQMLTVDKQSARRRHLETGVPQHWVYKRNGEPCDRCGTLIRVELVAARKLYWCVTCQR